MRSIVPPSVNLIPTSAKRVFQGVIYDTYQWQQPVFDGTTRPFEMLKAPDIVKVLAVKDDKLVMLEELQPLDAEPYYGLPGGFHDQPNETELEAARREVLEETGLTFAQWRLIAVQQPNRTIDQLVYVFVAWDPTNQATPRIDGGEKIKVELHDLPTVKRLLTSPKARFLQSGILNRVSSCSELLALPEYHE